MDARAIIAKLRDRQVPDGDELRWFAKGLATGAVSDAQAGAFAMATVLNGMDEEGRTNLTLAMRDSGDVMQWDVPGPVLDKHSTGGLGDCTSLILAPALAACGAYVPMISGRGLGHTGGTLDKLEAIVGVDTRVDEQVLQRMTRELGCAIVSAGDQMAPADRRLYAVRDVSATVESIDLITASILSKKLAAGLEALVLDVKCGSGAFMKTLEDAQQLANALVGTSNRAGCKTSALITDMDQPLATALGNALEVKAVLDVLTCSAPGRLMELTVDLGAMALLAGGLADDLESAESRFREAITSGAAAELFDRMMRELGAEDPLSAAALPQAPVISDVVAAEGGVVTEMDGVELGLAVVGLGGGRQVENDVIDPSVGISHMCRIGQTIEKGQPLCRVHASSQEDASQASARIAKAIRLGEDPVVVGPMVLERVGI